MVIPRVGHKYLFVIPRETIREYVVPAKILILKRKMQINTLLIEEVCLFPEVVLEGLEISWDFASSALNIKAPSFKCSDKDLMDITARNISYSIDRSIEDMRRLGIL